MNALVEVRDGAVRASSLSVAAKFEKRHPDVLRAITSLLKDAPELRQRNFALSFYERESGNGTKRRFDCYEMDRDGFALLAMGFTGARALKWKIDFIEAFNRMEAALASPRPANDTATLPPPPPEPIQAVPGVDRDVLVALQIVQEARRTHGRHAARQLWNVVGLPPIDIAEPTTAKPVIEPLQGEMADWFAERVQVVPGQRVSTHALFEDWIRWQGKSMRDVPDVQKEKVHLGRCLSKAGHAVMYSNRSWRPGLMLND